MNRLETITALAVVALSLTALTVSVGERLGLITPPPTPHPKKQSKQASKNKTVREIQQPLFQPYNATFSTKKASSTTVTTVKTSSEQTIHLKQQKKDDYRATSKEKHSDEKKGVSEIEVRSVVVPGSKPASAETTATTVSSDLSLQDAATVYECEEKTEEVYTGKLEEPIAKSRNGNEKETIIELASGRSSTPRAAAATTTVANLTTQQNAFRFPNNKTAVMLDEDDDLSVVNKEPEFVVHKSVPKFIPNLTLSKKWEKNLSSPEPISQENDELLYHKFEKKYLGEDGIEASDSESHDSYVDNYTRSNDSLSPTEAPNRFTHFQNLVYATVDLDTVEQDAENLDWVEFNRMSLSNFSTNLSPIIEDSTPPATPKYAPNDIEYTMDDEFERSSTSISPYSTTRSSITRRASEFEDEGDKYGNESEEPDINSKFESLMSRFEGAVDEQEEEEQSEQLEFARLSQTDSAGTGGAYTSRNVFEKDNESMIISPSTDLVSPAGSEFVQVSVPEFREIVEEQEYDQVEDVGGEEQIVGEDEIENVEDAREFVENDGVDAYVEEAQGKVEESEEALHETELSPPEDFVAEVKEEEVYEITHPEIIHESENIEITEVVNESERIDIIQEVVEEKEILSAEVELVADTQQVEVPVAEEVTEKEEEVQVIQQVEKEVEVIQQVEETLESEEIHIQEQITEQVTQIEEQAVEQLKVEIETETRIVENTSTVEVHKVEVTTTETKLEEIVTETKVETMMEKAIIEETKVEEVVEETKVAPVVETPKKVEVEEKEDDDKEEINDTNETKAADGKKKKKKKKGKKGKKGGVDVVEE
ncbi:hypothetical protein HK098_002471 [Nowakowskiella sp. JEL0407]|nr:hypothetical protein HK098_002471 [Nowakowskiella sp. JEL0407]